MFWLAVGALLGVMAAVMFHSSSLESQSYDESTHAYSGYAIWKKGNYTYNVEHPPLAKLLAGIPLLPLDPRLPQDAVFRAGRQNIRAPQALFYSNRIQPHVLIFWSRLPLILLTLAFGAVLAFWTRRHFGSAAALLALFFFALDPNLIAHGRYVTTDMAAAAFLFFAVIAWDRFLRTGRRIDRAGAGVVLGLALAAKFSLVVAPVLLMILYLFRHGLSWQSAVGMVKSVTATVVVAGCVLGFVYWPNTLGVFLGETGELHRAIYEESESADRIKAFSKALGLPDHAYLWGLARVAIHSADGQGAFLMGETRKTGWWYYFPVAFGIKTPVALLAGLIATIVFLVRKKGGPEEGPRGGGVPLQVLFLPPLFFFGLAMTAKLNIGLRHILPVYPFLMVLVAVALTRARRYILIGALASLLIVEHAMVAPHYLAFFNLLIGGPKNGPEYLVDSNVDWGQDIKKLGIYMDEQGIDNACVALFNKVLPAYYGFDTHGCFLPSPEAARGRVHAISATWRQAYSEMTGWLKDYGPVARVGYSIYVYDFRDQGQSGGTD